MLAFISNALLLLASAPAGGANSDSALGKFIYFWDHYLNYPGFEIWKFVNLFVFVAILIYILRKPLSGAFKAKREQIRAELIKAEEAKKAALAKLTEIEAKLAGADSEKQRVLREARAEIEQEKARLIAQADAESAKLNEQTAGEIIRIGQVARLQLRRFAVEESIRRADEKLRAQVNNETDSRLINSGIQAIGGLN
jgi:F-type H+-transporting ATPase subunit b